MRNLFYAKRYPAPLAQLLADLPRRIAFENSAFLTTAGIQRRKFERTHGVNAGAACS
jgi:hypothetical protein